MLRRLRFSKLKSSTASSLYQSFSRKLKQDIIGGSDTLSVISEMPSGLTLPRVTQAEKNLSTLGNNRAKELETVKRELDEAREELASLKTKHKAAVARRDTLEKEMKDYKAEVQGKVKILIEKTENDDRLIQMLKTEVRRLEGVKGVSKSGQASSSGAHDDDLSKVRAENARLKNQVKCLEIELEQKQEKVKTLLTSCVGVPDERLEERELRIAELEERSEALEQENFRLR